jgi:hypothetical protein
MARAIESVEIDRAVRFGRVNRERDVSPAGTVEILLAVADPDRPVCVAVGDAT